MNSFRFLLSLAFPPRCIGCDAWLEASKRRDGVCPSCVSKLNFLKVPAHLPKIGRPHFETAFSALAFEPPVLDWIHQFKYHKKLHWVPALADLLSAAGLDWKNYDAFVPVPLHWRRQWRRGFNPAHLLAHELGRKTLRPVWHALKKSHATKPQARLSGEERLQNMRGVFVPRPKTAPRVKGASILLVDDVLTTGATANACAKVLDAMKAAKVDVLTLARAL